MLHKCTYCPFTSTRSCWQVPSVTEISPLPCSQRSENCPWNPVGSLHRSFGLGLLQNHCLSETVTQLRAVTESPRRRHRDRRGADAQTLEGRLLSLLRVSLRITLFFRVLLRNNRPASLCKLKAYCMVAGFTCVGRCSPQCGQASSIFS